MCQGTIGRILSISGDTARVLHKNQQRDVNIELLDAPAVGDHVHFSGGLAIEKVPPPGDA